MDIIFKSGDIIKFDNKEYIVIQNYGSNGLIKENCENGKIIKGFSWIQPNSECVFVRHCNNDRGIINLVNQEYEEFFMKYKSN